MTDTQDDHWMRVALGQAERGLGQTWPNPSVGCAIVAKDRLISLGHTQPGGRPHAERVALDAAGSAARGATAYVTLEPCAHHGQTSPCADALVAAGIARVVTATSDPDPRTAGQGHDILRNAGIEVSENCRNADGVRANEGFFTRITTGRPFISLKLATTVDGKIAMPSGESRWITGAASRRRVHLMRSKTDAVMVGIGTALEDDPMLDVRGLGPVPQPARIVVDRQCRLPQTSRLAKSASNQKTFRLHSDQLTPNEIPGIANVTGVESITGLDLDAAMQALGKVGLTHVLCEGGAGLAAGLLGAGLVDRLTVFTAGKIIGQAGMASVGSLVFDLLRDAPHFTCKKTEQIGDDVMSVWEPRSDLSP